MHPRSSSDRRLRSARFVRAVSVMSALISASCGRTDAPVAPDADAASAIADSLAADLKPRLNVAPGPEAGAITLRTGDRLEVTVRPETSTGRCEQVAVTGTFDQLLFPRVGTCFGRKLNYGAGLQVVLGPTSAPGGVSFRIATSSKSKVRITGQRPSYLVRLDDGIFDDDFDDVVLDVRVISSEVEIDRVDAPLPDRSFTSLGGENVIELRARVADPGVADQVRWEVVDDPDDRVDSPDVGVEQSGLEARLTVGSPSNPRGRWPRSHPGAIDEKAFRYVVRAYFDADDGERVWSEPVVLVQHERDLLRQEYVDFGKNMVPDASSIGTFSTAHFGTRELNWGDYSVFPSTVRQREGIDLVRTLAAEWLESQGHGFSGLTVTSGFRNPAHHHYHAGAASNESQHLYGNAVDVRIWDLGPPREEVFAEFYHLAKDARVDACYEPERVVRGANSRGALTHSDFDWRPVRPCPPGW